MIVNLHYFHICYHLQLSTNEQPVCSTPIFKKPAVDKLLPMPLTPEASHIEGSRSNELVSQVSYKWNMKVQRHAVIVLNHSFFISLKCFIFCANTEDKILVLGTIFRVLETFKTKKSHCEVHKSLKTIISTIINFKIW